LITTEKFQYLQIVKDHSQKKPFLCMICITH